MVLQRITFEHFYIETVADIDKQYAVLVNPQVMQFYKCGNIYLALTFEDKKLIVNFAVNTGKKSDGEWVEVLRAECKKANFETVVFITSVNNQVVQNIAKKYNCQLIKTNPNFYVDGSDALVFEGKV